MIPMRINYRNEIETENFRRSLAEKNMDCYASYLRYLHSSMDNLADIICKKEDNIAIKELLWKIFLLNSLELMMKNNLELLNIH